MSKLKKVKENFDLITSQNATNWKLVLIWIVVIEIFASLIEFLNFDSSTKFSITFNHTLTTEIILGVAVTLFVWFCIYNIVFENRKYISRLLFIGVIGLYFIITNDFTLGFLLQNINPLHFFDLEFGFVFVIELIFKIVIVYLFIQLIKSLRNQDEIINN